MERVSIFIDGGNFYYLALKKIGKTELDFDFNGFAKFLENGRKITKMGKRFYTGTVFEREGDVRTKEAMSKQTKLFTMLKNTDWEIKTSKLRERTEEIIIDTRVLEHEKLKNAGIEVIHYKRLREKGIDVKLATDLIVGAIDDKYDTAIIVSSDTDIIPSIDWVRMRKNKKVEYIGFSMPDLSDKNKSIKPSLAFIQKTDVQRILVTSDLSAFFVNKLI